MAEEGYLAGVPVGLDGGRVTAPEDDADCPGLLVAVTERRTRNQIDGFVAALEKVIR
jgi:hypothetical protein